MPVPLASGRRRARLAQLALGGVTLLVVAMASVLVASSPARTEAGAETRFLIDVPDMPVPEAVSISPDGRCDRLFGDAMAHRPRVFVRPIDTEVAQKLGGTEGAGRLFWSPDSRWIAFFAGGRLKKVEAAGGPPQNICETPDLLGGTWNADGVIVFASSKGLQRVLAAGGQPSAVASCRRTVAAESAGTVLPAGRPALPLSGGLRGRDPRPRYTPARSTRQSHDAAGGGAIQRGVRRARLLLYHREGTLYAQPFNANEADTVSGEAIRWPTAFPTPRPGRPLSRRRNTGLLIFRNDPQASGGAGAARRTAAASERGAAAVDHARGPAAEAVTGGRRGEMGGRRSVARRQAHGGSPSRRGRRRHMDLRGRPAARRRRFTFDASQDNSIAGLVARRHRESRSVRDATASGASTSSSRTTRAPRSW